MIVVTGADGQLGTAFRSALTADAKFLTREDLDLRDLDRIAPTIASTKPLCVINCAAYTNVDGAESDEETARTVKVTAESPVAYQVDGDYRGETPVDFEVTGRRFRVLVP